MWENTSLCWVPGSEAALGSVTRASALMTSVPISPKVGSVIHHRCFLNRKISEPGNIPKSLEERDELANGRLQR